MSNHEQYRDDRIGSVLAGQYRLEALLGRGGMGAVYRAVQLSVNRPVAIKLISALSASQQREGLQRFRREADAMAKLRHPNTVRIFDFGSLGEDELFMVMELLEGRDLAERLGREGALPISEALGIARDALGSLSEAHALGIVHRDLKPANIFLARQHDGSTSAKLMDFGVASIKDSASSLKLTMTGEVLGTPTYMSPEQATGKPTDARSDLYSLGITLFQMLTGRTPFETESAAALLLAHVKTPAPRLAKLAPSRTFSEPLQALVDSLLNKDPERRPQSAAEALKRVEALQRSEPVAEPQRAQPARAIASPVAAAVAARPLSTTKLGMRFTLEGVPAYVWPLVGLAIPLVAFLIFWLAGLRGDGTTMTTTSSLAAIDPRSRDRDPAQPLPPYEPPWRNAKLTGQGLAAQEPQGSAAPARGQETRQELAELPAIAVLIRSSPGQARVFQADRELGKTPYSLQVGSATRVTLKLAGYAPYDLDLTSASKSDVTVKLTPLAAAVPSANGLPPTAAYAPAMPSPVQILQAMPRHSRQQSMLVNGPLYPSVAVTKQAYRRGAIDGALYDDVIWALKVRRKDRLVAEKVNYRNGMISRDEYDRRVRQIDYNYEGE